MISAVKNIGDNKAAVGFQVGGHAITTFTCLGVIIGPEEGILGLGMPLASTNRNEESEGPGRPW